MNIRFDEQKLSDIMKDFYNAQQLINTRPRKILNYDTPYQRFLLHLT